MICGHMRPIGDDRILHVCIKTDVVHEDGHLLIPWLDYADQVKRFTEASKEETPSWFRVLEEQAKHLDRQEFVKALHEDPMLRPVKPHNTPPPLPDERDPDHVKVEKLRVREEWDNLFGHRAKSSGGALGRSQDDTWKEVHRQDPEAWKSPDDAGRAVEPPPGEVPDAHLGVSISGRGKPPHIDIKLDYPGTPGEAGGSSMASVADVKAGLDQAVYAITETQGLLQAAKEKLGEAVQAAQAAADGSGHDAVSGGAAFLAQAGSDMDDVIQKLQAGIESFQHYSAIL